MKRIPVFISFLLLMQSFLCAQTQKIDRKALVKRHTVLNEKFDSLSPLSVGNGKFAFTVDITGLQSFPNAYANGVPLGTESEWAWHRFTDTANYSYAETLQDYKLNGRTISYSVQQKEPARKKNAVEWFRQNPHRLQLGNIGFEIIKKDRSLASLNDIQNVHQTLDMWTGEICSHFTVEDIPVDVITYGHQQQDGIALKLKSPLLSEGRIQIRIRFPYPTGGWTDVGNYYLQDEKHTSAVVSKTGSVAFIEHTLDNTSYYAALKWTGKVAIIKRAPHYFVVTPSRVDSLEFSCLFTEYKKAVSIPDFKITAADSKEQWQEFWQTGAAVDFSECTDERAAELERRIVLSQYLTKIQCAGNYPPQETGLTYNSWYGRPHLEMHWWHAIHFSLWGRNELMEKTLSWYSVAAGKAWQIAKRQGYEGLRWQKMTDNEGNESPSSVGAFLIWQQPHLIYFSELCYRKNRDQKTLHRYKELVFATADFMASYVQYDPIKRKYVLGPGLIPAQEKFKPENTFNPAYELVYWYWALNTAQEWRRRLHLPENKKWTEVVTKLSPLVVGDNKYLFTENGTDSYTNPEYKTDHPSVLGALGMMPSTKMVEKSVMKNTFDWIWNNWSWHDTWGWDFPMTAMTATRLGDPEKAIDALLMPIETNTYLNNGHNYQDKRLTIYLPGNGGLLAAIALMCAGYDGCETENPGIPKNGKWKVKWEGLVKMP